MKSYLHAGPFSDVAGLIVFLVIHHDWLIPIWCKLPFGLVIAALGGLAVSFALLTISLVMESAAWMVGAPGAAQRLTVITV